MRPSNTNSFVRNGDEPKPHNLISRTIQVPVQGKQLEFASSPDSMAVVMSKFYESKIPPGYKVVGVRFSCWMDDDTVMEYITTFDLIPAASVP